MEMLGKTHGLLKADINLLLDPYRQRGTEAATCGRHRSFFNTRQSHLLIQKMKQMCVNPFIIKRSLSFLTDRIQHVKVNQYKVPPPPPRTELSTVHYILITADLMTLISSVYRTDVSYDSEIEDFVHVCDANQLILNGKKTNRDVSR